MTAGRNQRLSPVLLQSSIGLLILAGVVVLAAILLWLKNIRFGEKSFRATILFSDAAGMLAGTRVDYRGVRIGQVVTVTPGPRGVALEVEISPADRLIASNARIEARQSGLIGESSINIIPTEVILPENIKHYPLDKNCDPTVIICNGSELKGEEAQDVNALIRSMMRLATFFNEPEISAALRQLATGSPQALTDISRFSDQAARLLNEINRDGGVKNLRRTLTSVDQAAGDLSVLSRTATGTLQSVESSGTIPEVKRSLQSVSEAAQQIRVFLAINDQRLGDTLVSIQGTSDQLQTSIRQLEPPLSQLLTQANEQGTIANVNQTLTNVDLALSDLKAIAGNADQLVGNLNQFSERLNDPQTILLLQQLLESARAAVQNLQKVTSDVDQLTGDPALRRQLIELIQGLSNLVSSTDYLQRQVQYTQQLNQISNDLAIVANAQAVTQNRSVSPAPPVKPLQKPRPLSPASTTP
ncbi:MAG: MlaD family protein [Synechocystis sp.]|nr:MlaD family protein [Synechocystis sp.]